MKPMLKLLVLFAAVSSLGVWILEQYPAATPIREGSSAAFWNHACDVKLGESFRSSWGAFIYAPRDGWFIYYDQGFEIQSVYRVRESAAMADFPAVVTALAAHPSSPQQPYVGEAFRIWSHADSTQRDAQRLLTEIRRARAAWLETVRPGSKEELDAEDQVFAIRWARSQRYGLTALFEFAYLAALILFAALPWLRRSGRLAWSIHLGLLPLLLMLPWYLGYVPLVFTSAFPAGGIVYPWLVMPFRELPWTEFDTFVVEHAPKLLEPLSQLTGPRLALAGGGGFGPTAAMGSGGMIAIVTFAIGTVIPSLRRRFTGSRARCVTGNNA